MALLMIYAPDDVEYVMTHTEAGYAAIEQELEKTLNAALKMLSYPSQHIGEAEEIELRHREHCRRVLELVWRTAAQLKMEEDSEAEDEEAEEAEAEKAEAEEEDAEDSEAEKGEAEEGEAE